MTAPVNEGSQDAFFSRTERLIGRAALDRLGACRVLVFGLGGVGGWCAEALVRTGVRHLTLVDSARVRPSNVNRQIQATALSVGQAKADALRQRLIEIHPQASITAVRAAFEESTRAQFDWAGHDYVIDAIDSLRYKVLLIEQCIRCGVKFYSSMGAAARLDPGQVRVDTLDRTTICPLARAVRQRLRERKAPLDAVTCVYSLEPALAPVVEQPAAESADPAWRPSEDPEGFPNWDGLRAQTNGAAVHVTAVFGFTLAGLVIRDAAADAGLDKRLETEASSSD